MSETTLCPHAYNGRIKNRMRLCVKPFYRLLLLNYLCSHSLSRFRNPEKWKPLYLISNLHSYQQLPDSALVQQYKQQRNQELLAVLYQRYSGLVLGVCLKYLKDADAAADASLDIYEELVQKVLKYEIDNFKGWLHTLTRNHCLMKLRSGKNKQMVELPEQLMQSEEMVHLNGVMEKEEHLTQLEQCIDKLNTEQKQVVQLFYLQEKCYNDITGLTGLPWNVVRSHIQNGRRNLKICMDQYAR